MVDHIARHSELEREHRQQSVSARVARQISSSSSMPSRPTRIVSNARRIGCRLSNDAAHTLDKPCCAPSATSVGMLRTVRVTGATMIDDRTEIASFQIACRFRNARFARPSLADHLTFGRKASVLTVKVTSAYANRAIPKQIRRLDKLLARPCIQCSAGSRSGEPIRDRKCRLPCRRFKDSAAPIPGAMVSTPS